MADCSLITPEGISACVDVARRWAVTAGDLIGLGSLAVISLLVGYLRHLRHRLTIEQNTSQERLLRATNAEAAQAQFDARIHERDASILTQKDRLRDLGDKLSLAQSAVEANAEAAEQNSRALEISSSGDTTFWTQPPLPLKESGLPLVLQVGCPTVLFANQKGGVGKSSCVASLAAYYASLGNNVLAVDLDYQGSLTSMMRLEQFGPPGTPPFQPRRDIKSILERPFQIHNWGGTALDDIINCARGEFPFAKEPLKGNLYYVSTDYELAQLERQEEYAWVLRQHSDDPRYRLAAFLKHAQQQFNIDLVLIDAPPRFTLGFINGLCAATHLFVPTIVDGISTRAVETFAIQFRQIRQSLNPELRWGGIIGMMTGRAPKEPNTLPQRWVNFASSAEAAARNQLGPEVGGFLYDAVVPRDGDIAEATATGIPFLQSQGVRSSETFQTLGNAILERINEHAKGNDGQGTEGTLAVHA